MTTAWSDGHLSRVPLPFGHRHLLLGHPVPPRDSAPLTIGLPDHESPDPDRVSTFHARETRPGWALPKPRGQRCSRDRLGSSPVAACRHCQRLGPVTRYSFRRSGLAMTRHHREFTHVRPSGLPLARLLPRTERGPLGFFLELRTLTGRTCERTSRRGPISNTDQELRTRHRRPPICEFTRNARPRVAPTQSHWVSSPAG